MDQTCNNCGASVPPDHTFCGRCGGAMDRKAPERRHTRPFSRMMASGRAKLVVLDGSGEVYPGMTFHLNASSHPVGRQEGVVIFEGDDTVSPLHADLYYEEGALVLEDRGSHNGCFVRIREPRRLRSHDLIRVGNQVLRFEYLELAERYPDPDGTLAYVSPTRPYRFRLVQLLDGGTLGQVHASPSNEVIIGREGCDLNFVDDEHLSLHHARIIHDERGFILEDLDSCNGTYVRVREPTGLRHGDLVFIGHQLLRVEFNP